MKKHVECIRKYRNPEWGKKNTFKGKRGEKKEKERKKRTRVQLKLLPNSVKGCC